MMLPTEVIKLNPALLECATLPDAHSIDDKKRIKFRNSPWQGFFHYFEKRKLDKEIEGQVKELFRTRYHFEDSSEFYRVWSKIGAETWTPKSELTIGTLREIEKQFKKQLVYHGPGIAAPDNISNVDSRIREIVSVLLHGGKVQSAFRDKEIARAVFVEHNPDFMNAFMQELQHEFMNLAANPPKSESEILIWKAFHGNLIALLSFTYPQTGMTIVIPKLNLDMTCTSIQYEIEVLDLPFTEHSSPMNAIGLTPKDKSIDAPTYISFLGTTFPAASGFATTLMADFTPGHGVGEAVYNKNKVKLEKWLQGKTNVNATGMSLGGSLSLHFLRDHHYRLAEVNAYVPAGLYPGTWHNPLSDKCQINIFTQDGDIVSLLGMFPTGKNVNLYKVYPQKNYNFIGSHARVFTGCKSVTVLREDPAKENNSFGRKFLTKLHQFLGPIAVFLPVGLTLGIYTLGVKVRNLFAKIFFTP